MAHGFTGSCICRGTSRHGDKGAEGELSGQMPPLPISTLSNVHCCFPKRPPVISNQICPSHILATVSTTFLASCCSRKDEAQCKARKPNNLIKPISDLWPVTHRMSWIRWPMNKTGGYEPGNSKQNNTPPHTKINLVIWPVALCGYRSLRFCKSSSGGDLTKLWSI